jgi:hypothetical protein
LISKLIGAIFLMAVGGGLTWYALAHHIVSAGDDTLYVPKTQLTFTDTFVDFDKMPAEELKQHPELVKALSQHGHGDLLAAKAGKSALDWLKDVISDDEKK